MNALDDLVVFARIETDAADVEPWADVLAHAARFLAEDDAAWLVKGYNAFDSLGSACLFASRWPTPEHWAKSWPGMRKLDDIPCTQERRNLRGGLVELHYDSYVGQLAGQTQMAWARSALDGDDPGLDWLRLEALMRTVWGVGRQTAFEWAEFLEKCMGLPVAAPDARLWESEGPRRSLQRLYGNDNPSAAWLNDKAAECRAMLAAEGIELDWEDFETIICDFNVMRDGRYYPGRHLAALREEVDAIDDPFLRDLFEDAWVACVPDDWRNIPPGIDKTLLPVYRDTGRIMTPC